MKKIFFLFVLILLLSGCSSLDVHREPGANLTSLKKLYVEHRLADGRSIDLLITRELQRLGYEAASGPMTMMPGGTDAVVSYVDRWTWDFSSYMIELDIEVSDPRTSKILATLRYFRPSLSGKTPEEMVQMTIDPLFRRG
ncbi:MAG TPA: lipoprotein [Opitutaceae bacterium]|nr:lipoprotein [Opitutaceae bacterium]